MSRTVGIIAGNGVLPVELAQAVTAAGQRVFVVGIEGEAGPEIAAFDHVRLGWGRFGRLFSLLEAEGVREVAFAGGVRRRPELRLVHLDVETLRMLPRLIAMLMSGDDTILSGLARMFEERGFELIGTGQVAPRLLLGAGTSVGQVGRKSAKQIEFGAKIVRALGPYDVGQGVVICGRRAVAVEGLEGTDAMLERVERLRDAERLSDRRDGVLVKVPKPQQDKRFDVPAIGPSTISLARRAGLKGIAGEAGGLLVLERSRTLELAQAHGLFVHGLAP